MPPRLLTQAEMKREVGIARMAQVLADAMAVRAGELPRGLSGIPSDEREWYRGTVRSLVEIYESVIGTAAAVLEARQREEEARRAAAAVESRLRIEQQYAAVEAQERGHDMTPWHCSGEELGKGIARASCRRCRRIAVVDIQQQPPRAGLALTTGCLAEADRRDAQIATRRRPDAFLADQHEADTDPRRI
jgi:hypothetical protein